jgi:flagellar motor switch protein FliG
MEETLTPTSTSSATAGAVVSSAELLRTMTGRRKAAVLILQLDRASCARVLSQLRESELEELTAEIARMGEITSNMSDAVLREFGMLSQGAASVHGGLAQSREMLVGALGESRADEIMGRLSTNILDIPFKFMQNADARQVLSFIADEHPQTIALVLAHVPPPLASQVLAGLDSSLQSDVAHRIAMMDRTSPDIIRQVELSLERRMSTVLVPSELSTVGGVQPLVEIINRADRGTEKLILEGLERRNKELADEVRSRMFVFEDLVNLDDRAVQLVLRQVEVANLAIALKGVGEQVRDKVMKNMSERAAESLAEEIELLGPVRVQTVEEAQTEVVRIIRTLEEEGQIVVSRGTEDEFVA